MPAATHALTVWCSRMVLHRSSRMVEPGRMMGPPGIGSGPSCLDVMRAIGSPFRIVAADIQGTCSILRHGADNKARSRSSLIEASRLCGGSDCISALLTAAGHWHSPFTMSEKEIIDLLRSIRVEVADLKVRIASMELHLNRQDQQGEEVLAAFRRLSFRLDALDFEDDAHDEDGLLQN